MYELMREVVPDADMDKEIKKQTNSTQLLLKPTPMGRIVKDVIDVEGKKFSDGIGWEKTPRQTRNTIHQSVTRKTKGSVEAISEEAQNLLVNVFSSANEATSHAKRKTLHAEDMKLVQSILAKNGLYYSP